MGDHNKTARYSFRVKLKSGESGDSEKPSNQRTGKTAKDYYKEYRRKLKQDVTLYTEFKRRDSLKSKQYRKSLDGEKLERYNEKVKIRMRAYRERLKEKGSVEKPATRQKIAKMRDYWREKKREQRSKMSAEAKNREKEKRRERYKSSKRKLCFETQPNDIHSHQTPKKSSNYIPRKPEKFAERINHAVQNATPRRKKALLKTGLFLSAEAKFKNETNSKIVDRVKRALSELKRKKTKEGRSRYQLLTRTVVGKYAVEHSLRKALDIKWEHWLRMSEMEKNGLENSKRTDAFNEDTVKHIERFYEYESVTLPTKRTVSSKTLKQKRVLTETLQQVHKRFLQDNPDLKVSLSHFRKLRPKEVLTVNQQKFASCLCEYCLNVQFKLEVINEALKSHGIENTFESKYHAVDISLCDKRNGEFHDRKCLERECGACGRQKLKTYLNPLVDADINTGKVYVWKKWKLGIVGSAAGKEVKRQVLAEQSGTLSELIDEFVVGVDFLANHLFIARWQYKQFNDLSKSVPEGVVVTIADFSENYRCVNQDEIQSAYYNYKQVTVFPMIGYYRCPDCKNSIVQESAVFISPDLTHDAQAVDQFSKTMVKHIQEHVPVSKEIQFSDGSASQFKSKIPFLHVSETKTHSMERAYFGSRHGKSPCDALGGLVKKKAELHVKSRKGTIQNAKKLFDYCKENLTIHEDSKCEHKKRVFFYQEEVMRKEPDRKIETIKGTRKVHSVRGVVSGVVKTRHLSCFCHVCLGELKKNCPNEKYVGEWKTHSLFKGDKRSRHQIEEMKDKGNKKQRKNKVGNKHKKQKKQCKGKQSVGKDQLNISDISNMKDLRDVVAKKRFEPLPQYKTKTFYNTAKTVDKTSMTLVPGDIPKSLYPATIQGDGNCLPRSASLLAYGTEDHYVEMRERIVCEMIQNEELYLDNMYLEDGMNPNGNHDVAKTFAAYSSIYMGTRLNKKSIRKLYEQEVLSICKNGAYMGMWQLASLTNILSCPVYSVYPEYGSHTVRNDMHRVFYPDRKKNSEKEPVYIMWTNTYGVMLPEKEFSVNHFVVLMPLTSTPDIDLDCTFDILDSSVNEEDDPFNDSILKAIHDLDVNMSDMDMEVFEEQTFTADATVKADCLDTKQQPANTKTLITITDATVEAQSLQTEQQPANTETSTTTTDATVEAQSLQTEQQRANTETFTTTTDPTIEAQSLQTEQQPANTETSTTSTDATVEAQSLQTEQQPANTETLNTPDATVEAQSLKTEQQPANTETLTPTTDATIEAQNLQTEQQPANTETFTTTTDATIEAQRLKTQQQPANTETLTSTTDATVEAQSLQTEQQPANTETLTTTTDATVEAQSLQTEQQPANTETATTTTDATIDAQSLQTEQQPANTETSTTTSIDATIEAQSLITEQQPANMETTTTKSIDVTIEAQSLITEQQPANTETLSTTTDATIEAQSLKIEQQPANTESFTTTDATVEAQSLETEQQPANTETVTTTTTYASVKAQRLQTKRQPANTETLTTTTDAPVKAYGPNTKQQPANIEQQHANVETLLTTDTASEALSFETRQQPTNTETLSSPTDAVSAAQIQDNEQPVRYHSGDYILLKHGRNLLPGVVDKWPWIHYFERKKKMWIMNETKYSVLLTDIVRKLDVPDICVAGSRLYYKFPMEDMK